MHTWIWAHPLAYFYLSTGSTLTPQSKKPPDQPDTTELRHKAVQFLANGLATTTRATYTVGQQGSQPFVKPIMLPQTQLQNTPFCYSQHSYLATSNIAHTTIKVYISAIRHMHVSARLHAQFNSYLTPRLQLILKDIQRKQAISHPQELSYQLPYKLCNPSTTCSSTNSIHMPTSWYGQPAVWPSLASSGSVNSPSPAIPATMRNVTFPQQIFQ